MARAYGYKDGSAITQIIKRLEAEAALRRELGVRISRLRADFVVSVWKAILRFTTPSSVREAPIS